jgi:superfamily II DNA or RNA helicase
MHDQNDSSRVPAPGGGSVNPTAAPATITPWLFDIYVGAEADGSAAPEQVGVLEADRARWRASLLRLLRDTEDALAGARSLPGDEREQVVTDLQAEQRRLSSAWARLTGTRDPAAERERADHAPDDDGDQEPGTVQLQVSWEPGRVVAWAAGRKTPTADIDEVVARLAAAGAPTSGWNPHDPVPVPGGLSAHAVAIPVGDVLGWLVAAGAGPLVDLAAPDVAAAAPEGVSGDIGPSVRWLGRVAVWAVELAARGAMVPLLRQRQRQRGRNGSSESNPSYSVRWTPALVDPARLRRTADAMPGAVLALDPQVEGQALTRSALTGMVDAICRDSARRLEVPAAPPRIRTSTDVAEAFLARLDGSAFDAPVRIGGEVVARVERWGRAVTLGRKRLVVRLDPPDRGDAWLLAVHVTAGNGDLTPLEDAMGAAGSGRRDLEDEITRLERLVPALRRAGSGHRGQVVLSQDEAWHLMTTLGPRLVAAGFDVRVPALSRRKPTGSLQVYADSSETAVGAHQLTNVRWSAVFGGVELSAADIARLAKEARPLIRSGGKWVEVDRADLHAAAAALAERAETTQLSGAEMLRLALGLEGSPLAGGISVAGGGWAADLLAASAEIGSRPMGAPAGFRGELRSYQAEALAWLGFLDAGGLGGCLALDMGLGKTPTMLAHLLERAGHGPALVVAPPAVVGNWFAEAARFTPGLRVVVHHGANRASAREITAELAQADVVITTYGTAVRDVEAIAAVNWERLILDEAPAIKNPSNDTSQQLRRIPARTRVALTGTPIENGLGDLWAILDFTNPGLVGARPQFIAQLSRDADTTRVAAEDAMRALNGILVFRRTKAEPAIAAELPDRIDELDHCAMTPEQIGMYQAVLDKLVTGTARVDGEEPRKGQILAAITALKQICNHPAAYEADDRPLAGRSGKLARLEEIVDSVFASGERVLVFTHFAEWGQKLAVHLTKRTKTPVECYHGGLSRTVRDRIIAEFQAGVGPGALVLSLKAGGTGLNLTAASHVVLYDRWWNPAVEDQARDRAWRIGQSRTVICHRLICPGTVDERVEEVVAGKRRIADLVLPKASTLADLDSTQLRTALGIRPDTVLTDDLLSTNGHDADADGDDVGDGAPVPQAVTA